MEDLLWSIVPFDTKKECSFLIVYITNITLIIAKSKPSMVRPPNYSLLLIIFKLGLASNLSWQKQLCLYIAAFWVYFHCYFSIVRIIN